MTFNSLKLHPQILKIIEELGFTTPTPIQESAIPQILEGHDVRGSAQTGTGKTAAFLLPLLSRLMRDPLKKGKGPRILILVPTRELALQVAAESAKYSKYLPHMKTVCIYGGSPYPAQNKQLARPYEILVATPGRLIDQLERKRVDFSRLEALVLDEADRMLDMGFIGPVKQIARTLPQSRQTLLFSATMNKNVLNLSKQLLKEPKDISVTPPHETQANIEQRLHNTDNAAHKFRLLEHLLKDPALYQALVFISRKAHADQLVRKLQDLGHKAAALHGDMRQRQRTQTLKSLRQEQIRVLVATDIAARGIDVLTISHVINFDLPMTVEDYVHRIGRTGRAGASGVATSFASAKEMAFMKRVEQFTGQKIKPVIIPGLEPAHCVGSKPVRRFRGGLSAGGKKGHMRRESSSRKKEALSR